jgi:hypothetical protein
VAYAYRCPDRTGGERSKEWNERRTQSCFRGGEGNERPPRTYQPLIYMPSKAQLSADRDHCGQSRVSRALMFVYCFFGSESPRPTYLDRAGISSITFARYKAGTYPLPKVYSQMFGLGRHRDDHIYAADMHLDLCSVRLLESCAGFWFSIPPHGPAQLLRPVALCFHRLYGPCSTATYKTS